MASPPVPDAIEYLWEKLHEMEPTSQLGGIYAPKTGYHDTRKANPPDNYSVVDAPDKGGPDNLAAALDWTFPEAQHGDYTRISKYASKLLASGKDPNDTRLDWMREFYGQADKDSAVEGWDYRYVRAVSSDSSHLWHIHFSFSRNALTIENMDLLLEVLRGEDMGTAEEVWDIDYIPAPRPPYHDEDYGDPDDPNTGNKEWRAKNWARRVYEGIKSNEFSILENQADIEAMKVTVNRILEILETGVPIPGEVVLSEESVAKVADAVVNEEQARLTE